MKKTNRKLELNKETLRVLSEKEQAEVVAGYATKTCPVITVDCTQRCTMYDC